MRILKTNTKGTKIAPEVRYLTAPVYSATVTNDSVPKLGALPTGLDNRLEWFKRSVAVVEIIWDTTA